MNFFVSLIFFSFFLLKIRIFLTISRDLKIQGKIQILQLYKSTNSLVSSLFIASGCVASSIESPQHRTQVELPQSPELISLTGLQTRVMSHLLGTEQASEPRKATKKTQAQLRFSNAAGDRLLEFSLQHASQKHLKASRHGYCKSKSLNLGITILRCQQACRGGNRPLQEGKEL